MNQTSVSDPVLLVRLSPAKELLRKSPGPLEDRLWKNRGRQGTAFSSPVVLFLLLFLDIFQHSLYFWLASTVSQPPDISSDLEFPLLTGVKSSNKVRPPARILRKPLVELNGPRRHPQGNDAKHSANKTIGENRISSDRRVYAASVHPYPERPVAVTKQSKPKEDFGNSTLPDISFGDFRAPITSTPKASVTRNVRDSIESEKEDFENSSAVTAHGL